MPPCSTFSYAVRGDVEGDELCFLSRADDRRAAGRNADVGVAEAQGSDAQGPVGVVLPLVVGVGIDPQSLPDIGYEAWKGFAVDQR